MKQYQFKIAFAICLISSLFLFSCKKGNVNDFATPQGVLEANLMNDDTFLFLQFSEQNEAQKENLNKIWDVLPKTEGADFKSFFNQNLASLDLTYDDDIKPVFGDALRMSIGLSLDKNDETKTDVITTFFLQDLEKAKALLTTLSTKEGFFEESLKDYQIVGNAEKNFYAIIYKDILLVASSRDLLRDIIEKSGDEVSSFAQTDSFKENFVEAFKKGFLFVYLKPADSLTLPIAGLEKLKDLNVNEYLSFYAEPDGIEFDANISAAPVNGEENKQVGKIKGDINLYDEISSNGLIVYGESVSFAKTARLESQISSASFASLSSTVEGYLGMNLKDDILTWLDKSAAFSLSYDGKNILPSIDLLVDASSNIEGAKKFADKIDTQLQTLFTLVNAQFPQYGSVITKDTVKKGEDDLNHINVDFAKLPEEVFTAFSEIPEPLRKASIDLSYGVYDEKYLLISTAPSLEQSQTLDDYDLFTSLNKKVKGFESNVMFVELKNILPLVDKLIELRSKLTGPLSEKDQQGYALFKQYAQAFDAIIVGSNIKSDYEVDVKGFVKIGGLK